MYATFYYDKYLKNLGLYSVHSRYIQHTAIIIKLDLAIIPLSTLLFSYEPYILNDR